MDSTSTSLRSTYIQTRAHIQTLLNVPIYTYRCMPYSIVHTPNISTLCFFISFLFWLFIYCACEWATATQLIALDSGLVSFIACYLLVNTKIQCIFVYVYITFRCVHLLMLKHLSSEISTSFDISMFDFKYRTYRVFH